MRAHGGSVGFCSSLFVIPKKSGGYRTIINLRPTEQFCDVLDRECVFAKEEMTPKIDGNSLRAEGQCHWSYRPYSGSIGIGLDHHKFLFLRTL